MELLWYVGQVEAHLGLFRDSVHLGTRQEHSLCRIYHRHGNLFWAHPMVVLVDFSQVDARFGRFADNVNLGAR
jgi:hypothetical protein